MSKVGIRALKQNASAVVAEAAAGEVVIITDRGRPVARMTPIGSSRVEMLVSAERARPARRRLSELPPPSRRKPGRPVASSVLEEMRDAERF